MRQNAHEGTTEMTRERHSDTGHSNVLRKTRRSIMKSRYERDRHWNPSKCSFKDYSNPSGQQQSDAIEK
jgi:hypothetical protein